MHNYIGLYIKSNIFNIISHNTFIFSLVGFGDNLGAFLVAATDFALTAYNV